MRELQLGVNIDHIATLRQARQTTEPSPLEALKLIEKTEAKQITLHLREDRRHIQDFDLSEILEHSNLPVNIECAQDEQIISLLCAKRPYKATLVPERREEITTEGGLDMKHPALKNNIKNLKDSGIQVATFIDPDPQSIELSKELGADGVELHTGNYANLYLAIKDPRVSQAKPLKHLAQKSENELIEMLENELNLLRKAAIFAKQIGLEVYAGHGLNAKNLAPIARIPEVSELNIGHSIIARAIFLGLENSIQEILDAMQEAIKETECQN